MFFAMASVLHGNPRHHSKIKPSQNGALAMVFTVAGMNVVEP
jgi:hypothetical protein